MVPLNLLKTFYRINHQYRFKLYFGQWRLILYFSVKLLKNYIHIKIFTLNFKLKLKTNSNPNSKPNPNPKLRRKTAD